MVFVLTYERPGRGAFPLSGAGGTLDVSGKRLGPYYRAPAPGSPMRMPGLTGALAVRHETPCTINDYAVHMAVKALQPRFGAVVDGILGPNTNAAIRTYQQEHHLIVDGVVGPQTCRSLFEPLVVGPATDAVLRAARGTITFESNWDPGAVGVNTPEDLGVGQISGPAHPNLSVNARLNPNVAIPWIVDFIADNFDAMHNDEDAAILAYNLGITGAHAWINAGRPATFYGTDTVAYLAKVKAGA